MNHSRSQAPSAGQRRAALGSESNQISFGCFSAPLARNAVDGAARAWTRFARWLAPVVVAGLSFMVAPAHAGVDVSGTVAQVHISGTGTLWFRMENVSPNIEAYCQPGWAGLQLYVPRDHADFPYYYGLLMTAATKQKRVLVANISIYNGTTSCDITKTGYGIMLY